MIKGLKEFHGYQTSDGKLHASEKEAVKDQAILNFKQWAEDEPLWGSPLGMVDPEDLTEYLRYNAKTIIQFLYQTNPEAFDF